MAASEHQKYLDTLLIEGYIYEQIFDCQRSDYPFDITNSVLLYYHAPYELLPFEPNFKSKKILLAKDNMLALNPAQGGDHFGILAGGASHKEAVWRLNV